MYVCINFSCFAGSTNRPDLVRCVFCGQYVGNWEEEDFPITEHRSLFPECPFIQGQEVGNIPLSQFPGFISTQMHSNFNSPGVSRMQQDESIDETGVREPEDSFDVTGVQPRGGRDANSGPEKRSKYWFCYSLLMEYVVTLVGLSSGCYQAVVRQLLGSC